MDLTPQDLWTLRNILIRTVKEMHEVLAEAARRKRRQPATAASAAAAQEAKPAPAPSLPTTTPYKMTYTIKEASEALGLSRSTIYKLIADQRLPTLRVGGRRLIEKEALSGFLTSLRQRPG